jgi:hypothetical protein
MTAKRCDVSARIYCATDSADKRVDPESEYSRQSGSRLALDVSRSVQGIIFPAVFAALESAVSVGETLSALQ